MVDVIAERVAASRNSAPLLRARGISKTYRTPDHIGRLVLEHIDFTLNEGEIVAILGKSGSGKSTFLRILAGLVMPSDGEVFYRGKPVQEPVHGIAMVFQSFALFPWLTVLGNVELGLEAQGVPAAERRRRAVDAIDLIGLDGFENAYPKELSGGMRQRVGFARALVVHPDLLLMDEPFSALDVLTAETLRTDLIDLWTEGRLPIKSVLMVTHNIEEAVLMCDRVLVLSSKPGRVAAEFTIDLPHPRNRLDPAFRQLVETLYARMTQRSEPKVLPAGNNPGAGIGMVLNHVSSNVLSGLIETLAGPPYSGHADLPVLAGQLQLEADEILHLGESLQLLRFAQLSDGDLVLTDAGKRFAHLETDARKKLFAEHCLSYVPVMALIKRVLDERPTHTAPAARFRNELEDYMSEDHAGETLKTTVSWGRYAELFAYDEQSETFSLENPG
jgi:NitT/TauT family transport system ATP-binding protein